jgi:hypothetical protein
LICEKGGLCEIIETADGIAMHCVCGEDANGTLCQYKNNDSNGGATRTLACKNGGVCQASEVNGVDDSWCNCPVGFEGILCERKSNSGSTSRGSKKSGKAGLRKVHSNDGEMRKKKQKGMAAKIAKDTRRGKM